MNNSHLKKMAQRKAIGEYTKQQAAKQMIVTQEVARHKKEAELLATQAIMATVLITLNTKNGWGKKRLNRFVEQVTNNLICVKEKFASIDDFAVWAKDFGIEGL